MKKNPKKVIKAWALVTTEGNLFTPFSWNEVYTIFDKKRDAELTAENYICNYNIIPCEITLQ